MNYILERCKEYKIEYDHYLNMIIINKPILVTDFIKLKNDLKRLRVKVNDIRVAS